MNYGVRGDRMFGSNMTALGWIEIAYRLRDFQITGPAWISTEKFDIEAKAERPASGRQMGLMLQALLVERFRLAFHREMKEMPVYGLVVARGGLKMKPSADRTLWVGDFPDGSPDGRPVTGGSPSELAPGRLVGKAIPMSMFVTLLADQLGRRVIDKTGLTGRYDIDLHYTPGSGRETFVDADTSTPSLFTALQEQLGLRLEATKGPVETMVVDRIERPGAN